MLTAHLVVLAVLTNVVTPLGILGWRMAGRARADAPALGSPGAALLLVALVWGWHVPAVLGAAQSSVPLSACLYAAVALSACLFWHAVFADADIRPWRSLAAVLSGMKAFGLLGVLLVLAPRPLYGPPVVAEAGAAGQWDQNMGGLLFMAISALGFLVAAVVIVTRVMARVEARPGWTGGLP